MTVETILLVLAVSTSVWVSGELEEKRITFRDPEHGAVERLYLQLLPASYGDPGPGNLVPLVLDFHGYIVSIVTLVTVTEGGCQVRDDGGGAASVLAVGRHCRGGGVRRGLPRGRPGLSLPTQEGDFQ